MKLKIWNRMKVAIVTGAMITSVGTSSYCAAEVKLGDLQRQIQQLRDAERKVMQEREARFRGELQKQERLTQEAIARRNAAEARGNALDKQWNENAQQIVTLGDLLAEHQGNLGELFGVTRQVAGDAASVLQQSLLTTQFEAVDGAVDGNENRAEFLRRLAGAKALPSIVELERLWYELTREMTDTGKVIKYKTDVIQQDNQKTTMETVRIGPFTAVSNGQFLNYVPGQRSLATLPGKLPSDFHAIARELQAASPDSGYARAVVDPASGALLSLYVQRPNFIERIQKGEVVGYVIVAVGILGALLAFAQAIYLVITRMAVMRQLKVLDEPKRNNPLGRVLLAFRGDGKRIENAELAELRISEAVLREVPKLERFQSFLRLAVAAGPLLGLIGTVIGMIITFHAIVASGSSDPKMMAHGIGQAMIATVLGLGIAIPLLFVNAGLAALSRGVTQVLDEQSQSLLAANTGARKKAA